MKKILLTLAILTSFAAMGLAQAKNDEISLNIANVQQSDLKQRIQIDETSNGNSVWLTGAKITAISGTSTPNQINVIVFGQNYKIQTAADTNIVRQYWGKSAMDLSEFSVGDIVNVYGSLDSADYFLVHAKTIRNVSIQKLYAVSTGKILSIASSTNTFTLESPKKGTSTISVAVDSNTKIYSGKNLKSFSDLQVGMKVMVRGIWDKTLSKIQALLVRMEPNKAGNSED